MKIQQMIIGNSLAVAGFSSKMPRAVVFGPVRYGGMRWESPYSILLHAQIKMLIGSLRLNDTVGKLIRLQLRWLQVLAGTTTPVLENKTKNHSVSSTMLDTKPASEGSKWKYPDKGVKIMGPKD